MFDPSSPEEIDHLVDDAGKDRSGWGCLALILAAAVITVMLGVTVVSSSPAACASTQVNSCVSTIAGGDEGSGSAHFEELTPQAPPSADATDGPTGQEQHDAAVAALASGQGAGGAGNPLNPQAAARTNTPTHTDAPPPPQEPQVIIVPQEPTCDPNDPHSPCYEPPCDTSDPHGPCYEPPPYHHNDECDPNSYYYDPTAICL